MFARVNNEPDFIGGLCYWLLSMCNPKERMVRSESDNGPESNEDSVFTRSSEFGLFEFVDDL